ncbi:hypothetical protein HYR99_21680 [Candidatus Poribacteria bacterium]|nr:hypothetical protein [Candidatus Poribacteria bacterium]
MNKPKEFNIRTQDDSWVKSRLNENANNVTIEGIGQSTSEKEYIALEDQLNRILSELSESFLQIPLENYEQLYESICTTVADFLEADVCSLFLKSSDTSQILQRQWIYMVASNRGSPWHQALQIHRNANKKIEYSWEEQGTTSHIWKQGVPCVCNSLAQINVMRGSRGFPGNPGKYDHFVWRGSNPWGCFRNSIGIPVRIIPPVNVDPDGNPIDPPIPIVIGVLKAENKTIPFNQIERWLTAHNQQTGKRRLTIEQFRAVQNILSKDYEGTATVEKILEEIGILKETALSYLQQDGVPNAQDLLNIIWKTSLKDVLGDLSSPSDFDMPVENSELTQERLKQRETFPRILSFLTPGFDTKDMIILGQVAAYIGRLEELRLTRRAAEAGLPLDGKHFLELPGLIDFEFIKDYESFKDKIEPIVQKLVYRLRVELKSKNLIRGPSEEKVIYRIKTGESFLRKLLKLENRKKIYKYLREQHHVPFRQMIDTQHLDIDDMGGIRVICDFPKQCLEVVDHIRYNWENVFILVEDIKHPEIRTEDGKEEVTGYYATHLTLLVSSQDLEQARSLKTFKGKILNHLKRKSSEDALYRREIDNYKEKEQAIQKAFNEVTFEEFNAAAKRLRDNERYIIREFVHENFTPENLYQLELDLVHVELQIRTAQQDTWANKYHRGFYNRYERLHEALKREISRVEERSGEQRIYLADLRLNLEELEAAKQDYIATAAGINEQEVRLQMASDQIEKIYDWCDKKIIDTY